MNNGDRNRILSCCISGAVCVIMGLVIFFFVSAESLADKAAMAAIVLFCVGTGIVQIARGVMIAKGKTLQAEDKTAREQRRAAERHLKQNSSRKDGMMKEILFYRRGIGITVGIVLIVLFLIIWYLYNAWAALAVFAVGTLCYIFCSCGTTGRLKREIAEMQLDIEAVDKDFCGGELFVYLHNIVCVGNDYTVFVTERSSGVIRNSRIDRVYTVCESEDIYDTGVYAGRVLHSYLVIHADGKIYKLGIENHLEKTVLDAFFARLGRLGYGCSVEYSQD